MSIFTAIRSLPAGLKLFTREVRREYNARLIDKAQRALERNEIEYAQMSEAERLQADADTDKILKRAAELKAQRSKSKYYAKRDNVAKKRARKAK